jgi:DNA polymerase-3 subunit alpha
LVISWAQSRAKERESLQYNLFDLSGGNKGNQNNTAAEWESAPPLPNVPDYSQQEKLRLEKELLGFYVSDHPLKAVHQFAKVLSPISLSELADQSKRTIISAIVMLTEVKPHLTKKGGEPMAFVQMEDLTGQAEGVVFPKNYQRIGSLIQPDARLIVWGKVDRKDDQTQLIIEDAKLIENIEMVIVELTPPRATKSELERLRTLLQEHSGQNNQAKVPVLARVTPSNPRHFRFDSKYWVQDYKTAISALNDAGFPAYASSLPGS